METKICSECKKILPKSKEFFFTKKYKQKTANGISEYTCLRSTCKKCHTKISTAKHRAKRLAELGCTLENYKETYCKIIAEKRKKYKELDIPQKNRTYILKKIRNGYNYTSIEKYNEDKKDYQIKNGLLRRKYDYGTTEKLTVKMQNQKYHEVLTDSIIALSLGFSVKEIPKEIIEIQRNIILLKRQAGMTHSYYKNNNQLNKKTL